MAKAVQDWFLREWMETCGVIAATIVKETGWTKSKVSDLYNGQQPYKREIVNELARVLKLRPYELLMHPSDAMAFRRMRESAATLVETAPSRTGTHD